MQSFADFRATHIGRKADYDKKHGGECVDLYNFYMRDVWGLNPYRFGGVEYAYQLRENLRQYPEIEWVDNNPNDPNQIPPMGAVVVFSDNFAIKGGHVGMRDEGTSSASLLLFDQVGNPVEEYEKPPSTRRYNWNNVLGWAILKKNVPADPGGGNEVIQNTDQADKLYRLARPNGTGTSDELAGWVGKPYTAYLNGVQPELRIRDEALRQKDVYITAMESDLKILRDQAIELQKRPTNTKMQELVESLQTMKSGTAKHVEHIRSLEAEIKAPEIVTADPEKNLHRVFQQLRQFLTLDRIKAIFRKSRP